MKKKQVDYMIYFGRAKKIFITCHWKEMREALWKNYLKK